jgi:hypothetical protein
MMIKTIKTTVNVLVALSIGCVAVMFAVSIVILARYLIVGGLTAYHLLH